MKRVRILLCVLGLGAAALMLNRQWSTQREVVSERDSSAEQRKAAHVSSKSEVTRELARSLRGASSSTSSAALSGDEVRARQAIAQGMDAQEPEVQRQFYQTRLANAAAEIGPTVALINQLRQDVRVEPEVIDDLEERIREHNARIAHYNEALATLAK